MARFLPRLEQASQNVLSCRDLGHAWQHTDDHNIVTTARGSIIEFGRTDRCIRCGASRTRTMEVPSFRIKRTSVRYPDDYLAPRGSRYTRADARREDFSRLLAN